MAIWQYKIELVPKDWIDSSNKPLDLLYAENGCYETSPAWEKKQPSEIYKVLISDILPVSDSWDEDLELWGTKGEHDIHVWRDNGKIFSIGCRIDLRKELNSIITKFLSLALELECYIFAPGEKEIFEPLLPELIKNAKKSNAYKYVTKPDSLFEELATKHNKPFKQDK